MLQYFVSSNSKTNKFGIYQKQMTKTDQTQFYLWTFIDFDMRKYYIKRNLHILFKYAIGKRLYVRERLQYTLKRSVFKNPFLF